jgi:30S ribosomal protein 3
LTSNFKLNILWLDNKLGIAIDQIQQNEQIPLTNYFFWQKTDAWTQIKNELEAKSWIQNKDKAKLLNSIASIMNEGQSLTIIKN